MAGLNTLLNNTNIKHLSVNLTQSLKILSRSRSYHSALEVFFIKNTPQIQGGKNGVVYAELTSNRPNTVFRCHIKRFNTAEDCKNLYNVP